MSSYHHTQAGTVTLAVLLASAIVVLASGFLAPGPRWVLWGTAVALVVLAWLFSSLTVEIGGDTLEWHFGPGFWRYRLERADIASVAIVRNQWWNGFGIRMRPGFRLYNVSGLNAVELRLRDGDIRRIGTDDPHGLAAALRR